MRILAFDTAAGGCTGCVWENGRILARAGGAMMHGQAEALVPLIQTVMTAAAVRYESLDRIAVTVGPGSFTGLRVGLATARGLALASGVPVAGVTTLEVFAHSVGTPEAAGTVLACVDARREDVYVQAFTGPGRRPMTEPTAVRPADVAGWLQGHAAPTPVTVVGDGVARLRDAGWGADWYEAEVAAVPDVAVLARLAAAAPLPEAPPSALYIRPPDATLPHNGGRLRP